MNLAPHSVGWANRFSTENKRLELAFSLRTLLEHEVTAPAPFRFNNGTPFVTCTFAGKPVENPAGTKALHILGNDGIMSPP